MALDDWEVAVMYTLGDFMPVPTAPMDDWQHWGLFIFQYPLLAPLNPPNPYEFTDWVSWGERLVDALSDADSLLGSGGSPGQKGRFIISQQGQDIQTQSGFFLATH
jgi:hypothetical protein